MRLEKTTKARFLVQTASLMLFPVTLNFLSPYVIVDGAFRGIVSGSALVFAALFLSSPFLGRAWCSWACPAGVIQDQLARANGKRFVSSAGNALKYVVWGVWTGTIAYAFATAGIGAVNPLHMTDSGISVDAPARYIIYFSVIFLFSAIALAFGRRASCHAICWMAPFMVLGRKAGVALRLPGLRLSADPAKCVSCGSCERVCPMSLSIGAMAKAGAPEHPECVQCGECVRACPHVALELGFRQPRAENPAPLTKTPAGRHSHGTGFDGEE